MAVLGLNIDLPATTAITGVVAEAVNVTERAVFVDPFAVSEADAYAASAGSALAATSTATLGLTRFSDLAGRPVQCQGYELITGFERFRQAFPYIFQDSSFTTRAFIYLRCDHTWRSIHQAISQALQKTSLDDETRAEFVAYVKNLQAHMGSEETLRFLHAILNVVYRDTKIEWGDFWDVSMQPLSSFITYIFRWHDAKIKRPTPVFASDLKTGQRVALREGVLGEAQRIAWQQLIETREESHQSQDVEVVIDQDKQVVRLCLQSFLPSIVTTILISLIQDFFAALDDVYVQPSTTVALNVLIFGSEIHDPCAKAKRGGLDPHFDQCRVVYDFMMQTPNVNTALRLGSAEMYKGQRFFKRFLEPPLRIPTANNRAIIWQEEGNPLMAHSLEPVDTIDGKKGYRSIIVLRLK